MPICLWHTVQLRHPTDRWTDTGHHFLMPLLWRSGNNKAFNNHTQHHQEYTDTIKTVTIAHTTSSCLDADTLDNLQQGRGSLFNLLHFIIVKSLVEDGIDAILTDDDRQTQKHFLLYAVIALHSQAHDFRLGQSTVKLCSTQDTLNTSHSANTTF